MRECCSIKVVLFIYFVKDGYYKMLFKGENKVIFFKIRNVKLL